MHLHKNTNTHYSQRSSLQAGFGDMQCCTSVGFFEDLYFTISISVHFYFYFTTFFKENGHFYPITFQISILVTSY